MRASAARPRAAAYPGTDRGSQETRSTEALIRAGHALLTARGLAMPPAKVSKLARRYAGDAALRSTPFEAWFLNVATCPPEVPRRYRNEFGVVDSTGETAVRRVLAGVARPDGGGRHAV